MGRRGGRGDVAGLGHRHGAVGDRPAAQALTQRLRDVARHHRGEVGDGLVDVHRHRADVDLEPERDAGTGRCRVHPQPERDGERVTGRPEQLGGLARADRALDADRRRLAERHLDAEVGGQRGLDDLLLHLPVEGDGQLTGRLPDVDQRVLLGELPQGDPERGPVRAGPR